MKPIPSIASLMPHIKQARMKAWDPPPYDRIIKPGPGQESVWDFPRPPIVQEVPHRVRVETNGITLADTNGAMRICETAGAPCYYIPPEDIRMDLLSPSEQWYICEWKGIGTAYDLTIPAADGISPKVIKEVGWGYLEPLTDLGMGYEKVKGYIAFYASKVDGCYIGDEKVTPQPGGYYGGWVTSNLLGPIKGEPGGGAW